MISVNRFVCHSRKVWQIAGRFGWLPGARYTNLRDVREVDRLGLLDIDWKNYNFEKHLAAAKITKPRLTVAQDVLDVDKLDLILDQAERLNEYADQVIVVPKDMRLSDGLCDRIPSNYLLGYSVPTRYGGTEIPTESFDGRQVHLLGGRPDVQRELGRELNVVSLDTNRFTLDASFGDYFDGRYFKPHPRGGYDRCIEDSLRNINKVWRGYKLSGSERL